METDLHGVLTRATAHGPDAIDEQATLAMMRRVAISMFLVGGVVCMSGVWTLQQTPRSKLAQGLVAGGLTAVGVLIWLIRRPRRSVLEAGVLLSITLLSALVGLSEPLGMAPLFYLWPIVYVAYFCRRRTLAVTYGYMVVTLAAVLVLNTTHELKLDTFTGTTATIGIMAVLVSMMTNREAVLRRELAVAAETDPLTGLLNRRSFNPHLELLVADAAVHGRPLSVVMFDLDHFKRLNDERGHLVGDRALQEFAAILRAQSRDGDLICRFGGEEFAVGLPGAAVDVARRYTERVASALVERRRSIDLAIMTSVGICSLTTQQESADALLLRADDALYAAKAGGRCRQASWIGGEIVVGAPFEGSITSQLVVTDPLAG
ncbi:MAG: diguanylate cyclase [Acidimicrobiia bacterium]|nr:diguanylate cyclase [Acidimicrobiia bacterium]